MNKLLLSSVVVAAMLSIGFATNAQDVGTWATTGALAQGRSNHTTTLLPNGKVLVAGGCTTWDGKPADSTVATCELYDPGTGTWTATGAMKQGRYGHTATLLGNGKVLVVGASTCELFDPETGAWAVTGSLAQTSPMTTTLLKNGKVLVTGGRSDGGTYYSSCELYNPESGTWAVTNPMADARSNHSATLLADGRVIAIGGYRENGSGPYLASCEIYNPSTEVWASTGAMTKARLQADAILLPDGKVLVAGRSVSTINAECEIYDPRAGTWVETGAMAQARSGHALTVLPNGKVLAVGGTCYAQFFASCELYDPAAGTWSGTGSMAQERTCQDAMMLSTGRILVAGGMAVRDGGYLASCELFDPGYRTVSFTVNDSSRGTVNGTLSQVVAKGGSTSAVTAVPTTGYSFSIWSGTNGFVTTSDNPLIVSNVQSDMTITANFVVATYTLHYGASANGSLEGATEQTVNHGASGTAVTAVPDVHHHFANWSDGSTSNPRTDSNVTANIAVTANFAIDTFTLVYSAGEHGSLSGETAQTVDYGTSGSAVTAVPATGYHFVKWSDDSTSNPRADSNVTENLSVTASFAIDTFTLSYTAGTNGTLDGELAQTVDYGASGSAVIAVPAVGHHFLSWSDGVASNPRTDSNVKANVSVTASFAINTFALVYAAGEHGTLTGTTNQTVDYGASGSVVTAVPAEHYHFVAWSDGSTTNPRTDSAVKTNLSVTASFAIDTFVLSYIAGAHGALSGETSQTIEYGASGSTVTAVPDDHYHFVAWSDGGAANPRTDTEITENLTVTANFSIDTFTLTYTPGKYGSLTGLASQTVDYGASGSEVAAVPDAGCKFLSWNDGSTVNPRVDSGIARDISVTANFINIVSYVTPDGAGDNSGDSWSNAIPGKDLKSAIANTASEQIWVAAGTYKPNDANPTNASRAQSFSLRNKLAVYGGFAGTETDTAQRDIAAHPSVLSGEIGKSGDFDNCQHVLRTSGLDATAILDGFTITGGNAGYDNVSLARLSSSITTDTAGGGMCNVSSSPTLRGCTFHDNLSADDGGGMFNHNSSPSLVNCTFSENSAEDAGGGMFNAYTSAPTLVNCVFQENSANSGGAMYNLESAPALSSCTLVNNLANNAEGAGEDEGYGDDGLEPDSGHVGNGDGGGLFNYKSSATLDNCTLTRNSATDHGGGLCNISSSFATSPTLTNCALNQNSATRGGGLYNYDSTPTLTSCVFKVNWAEKTGGGMRNNDASPTLKNCEFKENWSNLDGGGMHNFSRNSSDYPVINDTSFTKNWAAQDGGGMANDYCFPRMTNCVFTGNWSTRDGGGMSNTNKAYPRMTACVFDGNLAKANGGAISNSSSYSESINCTFYGNHAATNGGAFCNVSSFPISTNCTFSGNYAALGGGMYNELSHPTIENSLFWGDYSSTDSSVSEFHLDTTSSFWACSQNVVQGGLADGDNIITEDPKLDTARLRDNGGPTMTIAVLAGGSGIDMASSSVAPTTDQRGYGRDGYPDIGAYEYNGMTSDPRYTVTFVAGAGGTLEGQASQTIAAGADCSAVKAVPNTGHSFAAWDNGFGTSNPLIVTNVAGNMTITASFVVNTYTLTYTAAANGTLQGTTTQTVNHGGSGTAVRAVPATGHHFVSWSDGSTTNPRTDANVTSNVSVSANFAVDTFMLVYSAGAHGTLSGKTSQTLNYGASGGAVTAIPGSGYSFASWSDGSTANPRSDTNVTANITVSASFAAKTYIVNFVAGKGGSIEGQSSQAVAEGGACLVVTAVPDSGFNFTGWDNGFGTANPLTVTNVKSNLTITASFSQLPTYVLTVNNGAGGGNYLAGASVAVTATIPDGKSFLSWTGGTSYLDNSSSASATITMPAKDIAITATFQDIPTTTYTLTVVMGTGSGDYTSGTSVTITANAPATGMHFATWTGDTAYLANPASATTTFTMPGKDASVTATYEQATSPYVLTVNNGTGSGNYSQDEQVSIEANAPADSQRFSLWIGDVKYLDDMADTQCVATMPDTDISVTATYVAIDAPIHQLSVAEGSNAGSYATGAKVTIYATAPAEGMVFAGWTGDTQYLDDATSAQTNVTMPDGDVSVTATFIEPPASTYTLTVTNGSGSGDYAEGVKVSIAANAPAAGKQFAAWTGDIDQVDSPMSATAVITMPARVIAVTANYEDIPVTTYTIIATAGANGAINPSGPVSVVAGGSQTFTITASEGYKISDVLVDDNSVGAVSSYEFTNVVANHSIAASFAKKTYAVTFIANEGGTLEGDATQTSEHGGTCSAVRAVPNAGHSFTTWDNGFGATNPLTVANVTADMTIMASFSLNTYTLTYAAGANGSLEGQVSQTVNYGASGAAVKAVPAIGYHFASWSDGSTMNPRTDANVMANLSVTASFEINTYTLNYTALEHGTLTGATPQIVNYGSGGSAVTAVPGAGYHFVSWSDGSTANPRTDTDVKANMAVEASFAINTYILAYSAGANGTLVGQATQTVNHGASGSAMTAVPSTGYRFVSWTDGSSANPRVDANVTADITVAASFAINTYTLAYTAGANGTLSGEATQTVDYMASGTAVTAVADTGYHFVSWSDGATINPRAETNVTASLAVSANFAIDIHTVTFVAGTNGTITGTIVQLVNHGADCSAVSAAANEHNHFTAWSGDHVGAENPLTITNVVKDMTITATFAIDTFTLAYTAGDYGKLSGEATQTVPYGGSGTAITIVPDTGYHVVAWSDGSTATQRTDSNVTKDIAVTASFAIDTFTLSYVAVENGAITGEATQTVNYLASGTAVRPVPATGYHFVSWSDGSTANPRTDASVTSNVTVTASFSLNSYSLTYVANANGKLTGTLTQTVPHGGSGTSVTAVADAHYHFVSWSDGSTANPRTDTDVKADLTVTASFAIDTLTLTYSAGTNGKLEGSSSQTVPYGSSGSTVTAVPDTGYRFMSWSDGSTANPRTDTKVTTNLSVTATFALNVYTVTFMSTEGGSLEGQTSQSVEHGSNCSAITAVRERGYAFTTWDNGLGATNPLTVANVKSDLTITATFTKKAAPEYWVAYGSMFTVNASDLPDSSAFAKAPKVVAYKDGKAGGKAKGLGFKKGSDSVNCVWQGKDTPGIYTLLVNGETLTEEFVVENPNDFVVTLTPDTGVANDKITVTGSYFGSTCPKVTMQWEVETKSGTAKTKKATCKVVKPYKYDDANGKPGKSVMYVGQEASESGFQPGDSELTFVVPKGITETTPATLKLNCNGSIVQSSFNATE